MKRPNGKRRTGSATIKDKIDKIDLEESRYDIESDLDDIKNDLDALTESETVYVTPKAVQSKRSMEKFVELMREFLNLLDEKELILFSSLFVHILYRPCSDSMEKFVELMWEFLNLLDEEELIRLERRAKKASLALLAELFRTELALRLERDFPP